MPSINLIDTIKLIHEAQFVMTTIPKDRRPELQQHIDSVLSIAAIHLRVPNPEIRADQMACVEGLINHMQTTKETA